MSTIDAPTRANTGAVADRGTTRSRRLVTETKASFKTTELVAYVAVLVGILVSAAVIKGTGAHVDVFKASQAWLYATILTVGYMISRGLAKSGSAQPYDDDRS